MATRRARAKEYHPGRIKWLVQNVAKYAAEHPEDIKRMAESGDFSQLHAIVKISADAAGATGYGDGSRCFNCGGNMLVQVYTADVLNALLLLAMGRDVRERIRKGVPFTEANKVYVPGLPVTDAIKKRHSQCGYLNVIKQPESMHKSGFWVITEWGWKALAGEPIPKKVRYWHGKLLGRSEEMTTLGEMFRTHTDLVQRAIARRKQVEEDHRGEYRDYQPIEWVEYAKPPAATLL